MTQASLFEAKHIRGMKKHKIYRFFLDNLGLHFSTLELHRMFGTATRTRISEINRDPSAEITIKNRTGAHNGHECSVYWAERKT